MKGGESMTPEEAAGIRLGDRVIYRGEVHTVNGIKRVGNTDPMFNVCCTVNGEYCVAGYLQHGYQNFRFCSVIPVNEYAVTVVYMVKAKSAEQASDMVLAELNGVFGDPLEATIVTVEQVNEEVS